MFCLRRGAEGFPAYVRSGHNMYADGLTRWPHSQLEDWVSIDGIMQVDAASRLWAGMSPSHNPDADVSPPPNTFALLGNIMRFFRPYNYRVCEWRPSHYAVASILENWGAPSTVIKFWISRYMTYSRDGHLARCQ